MKCLRHDQRLPKVRRHFSFPPYQIISCVVLCFALMDFIVASTIRAGTGIAVADGRYYYCLDHVAPWLVRGLTNARSASLHGFDLTRP